MADLLLPKKSKGVWHCDGSCFALRGELTAVDVDPDRSFGPK
jgi:hypothetical protein